MLCSGSVHRYAGLAGQLPLADHARSGTLHTALHDRRGNLPYATLPHFAADRWLKAGLLQELSKPACGCSIHAPWQSVSGSCVWCRPQLLRSIARWQACISQTMPVGEQEMSQQMVCCIWQRDMCMAELAELKHQTGQARIPSLHVDFQIRTHYKQLIVFTSSLLMMPMKFEKAHCTLHCPRWMSWPILNFTNASAWLPGCQPIHAFCWWCFVSALCCPTTETQHCDKHPCDARSS